MGLADLERVYPRTRAAWRRWLTAHHTQKESVWLVLDKKGSGRQKMTYADAVEEALCFGWIDGVIHAIDADCYKILLAPRRPKSVWSALNKSRIKKVIAAGLMTPAGQAKINAAKKDGSWAKAYPSLPKAKPRG